MKNNCDTDVCVSSRIRFARNLADYPFPGRCDAASAKEIIEKVEHTLGSSYRKTDFSGISKTDAGALVENHSISPEFGAVMLPHALFCSSEGDIKIMVCEEDHIRLQSMARGLALDRAYKEACRVDDILCSGLKIAFDERLGFLTHCPTNLGTGMRASVMLFLPALTAQRQIKPLVTQLAKLGVTIRGLYGEGSEAMGCLYQMSNQETMGSSEESIISKLNEIIAQIIKLERDARTELMKAAGDRVTDRAMRSLGTLKYAHMLSSSDFMSCYSDVRMGVSLDIIKDIDCEILDRAFTEVMPFTLMKHLGKRLDEHERDLARAKRIRELV